MDTPPSASEQFPQAPSTMPGPLMISPRPSTWPVVIGIIAIVLGGLAAVQGCFGAVVAPFTANLSQSIPTAPGQPNPFAFMRSHTVDAIAIGVATAIMGCWLLVSGIALTQRKAWSRLSILLWSPVKIVFVVVAAIVQTSMQQDQLQQMTAASQPAPPMMKPAMNAFLVVIMAMVALWGWAGPVFCLIWFNRRKVKDETAAWAAQAKPPAT